MRPYFLPERLYEIRTKKNLSKAEAARRLGVSKSAYYYYESGERNPTLPILERIAQEFEVSVAYLTGASDRPEPASFITNDTELVSLIQLIREHPEIKYDDKTVGPKLFYLLRDKKE